MMSPAYATTIDVAGERLDFGNAVDENILENGAIGADYLYENVVTVGGVQVDALVTILDMSDNSMGDYTYEQITDAQITLLNEMDPNHVDVAGCYSNEDYVTAMDNNEAYDFLGFNAAGSLRGGDEVRYIDGFEDDPEIEHVINTSLDLCDPGYTGEVDGFVDINVAFQVDGAPVTLTNVTMVAHDIDGEQEVTFWSPAPSTFETSGDDSLVTIEDAVDSDDYVTFVGPYEPSGDGFEERYIGEVTYESVSDFNYTFRLVNGSGGSLQLEFESYFHPADLASTGTDAATPAIAGLAILGVGAALLIVRRVRRNRS